MESVAEETQRGNGAVVTGPAAPTRTGGTVLSVLAVPLNVRILEALAERPMRLAELRKATGLPAQTTLRGHLTSLLDIGIVAKRPTERSPFAVENELTPMGADLLDVAGQLDLWLGQAPDEPISLESGVAKGAIKALLDGWDSTMVQVLAGGPLSLTELDSSISELSYPALERRLSSMRIAGLVEAQQSEGFGTPYGVTDWARRGAAPLAAAGRCEWLHLKTSSAPATQLDVEAAFLLATPLVRLAGGTAGSCQFEVEANPEIMAGPAGVQITVDDGAVVSCVSRLQEGFPTTTAGSVRSWFTAMETGKTDELRFSGDRRFAEALVNGLRSAFVREPAGIRG